jgi:hypothetical protein
MNEHPSFYWGRFFKKVRIELIVFLAIIGVCAILLPHEALVGLTSLLASKVLALTIGVMLAHLLRIVAFSFLDLSKLIEDHHWPGVMFLAVWYFVIIYCVAMGG